MTSASPRDLVGVGIGPANLSLAALAQPLAGLDAVFLEQRQGFDWHPGLLIEGTRLQVPFLADLVSLVDPTSPWSFLNHLRARERLFPFYFAERPHILRAEYEGYCRWVAERLPALRFGHQVDAVRWNPRSELFEVDFSRVDAEGGVESLGRAHTRNVVLGVGTEPYVPEALRPLVGAREVAVCHAADYLEHRERVLAAGHVTVVGAGQSGAEVFLDLLRNRPVGRERLHWLARTGAFAPMEYSKLGLEHFTPDYAAYFHALDESVRDRLLPAQWQLYKGIDAGTIAAVQEELYRRSVVGGGWPDVVLTPGVRVRTAGWLSGSRVELHLEHGGQGLRTCLATDAVVLATGFRERPVGSLLRSLEPYVCRDAAERPRVDEHYRVVLAREIAATGCAVYVQNAESHAHGVGAPDLGMTAWRSARILNAVTGEESYPLPRRTAFTSFGLRERERVVSGVPSTRGGGTVALTPLVDGV
ncbi:lysine N6-hydroxylase [Streptomyces sp. B3I7]|uniref:lysine N(6)-hydroxylase/L-ornithine N(5)-oxygenase family protein n=1 Tax=unclassified Streptomyces TaxID=2593676 RepID=UPI00277E3573|nr:MULTISPECIES: SidA/IucD/PvdA family monooxygenase [unclassified Streptomyces]MDQ0786370.1 lysine N6-hydroxylase [Streptomyces sp. B3I8]MDQ0814022.1 lysine N6-hydroxylase [Streptomyces sp. B3I7]